MEGGGVYKNKRHGLSTHYLLLREIKHIHVKILKNTKNTKEY